jgi:hypothetical protein
MGDRIHGGLPPRGRREGCTKHRAAPRAAAPAIRPPFGARRSGRAGGATGILGLSCVPSRSLAPRSTPELGPALSGSGDAAGPGGRRIGGADRTSGAGPGLFAMSVLCQMARSGKTTSRNRSVTVGTISNSATPSRVASPWHHASSRHIPSWAQAGWHYSRLN